ncbi:MAG: ribosome maturation factor RimP [Candidatus Latescibacterota bacterium]
MMGVHDRRHEVIHRLLDGVLQGEEIELVELKVSQRGRNALITAFIDKPGGVTVEDCARFTREAKDLFDMEQLFEGSYSLEVSSPGIDRPLRSERDFQRAVGQNIRLTLEEGIQPAEKTGRLQKVEDHSLTLESNNEQVEIPLSDIHEGKITVQF